MNDDLQHLKLLSVFHYVVAGFASLFALIPVIHVVIGIALVNGRLAPAGDADVRMIGWALIAFASCWILGGLAFAICVALAGRNLGRKTRYTFCLVVAAIECVFMPFGTVLGILTILLLSKAPMKALFGEAAPAAPRVE